MENVPSEILCIIFSYLDKTSRKRATATSKLWFDLIRSDSNLSNHISYRYRFQDLQRRIENLEWDWKRWPALKSLEFHGRNINVGKEDILNALIDFKKGPTLEIVIFDVMFDFADLYPNYPREVATVSKLAFNPHHNITQFGVEHIWSLKIHKPNDEMFKLINKNRKVLKELAVHKFSYLYNLAGMDSLLKLRIMICSLSELKVVDGLKKLKILTVRRLANLNFLGSMDALLELSITFVSGRELKEHDLSNIVQRFKNLQKLNIRVIDYSIQAREYAEIVENVFQNSATRIKIVFNHDCMYTYLTKEPFERCVLKKEKNRHDCFD